MSHLVQRWNCKRKSENLILGFSYLLDNFGGAYQGKVNYIFSDIQVLCERLDELDIEDLIEEDCNNGPVS